jgi:hypothetical protein
MSSTIMRSGKPAKQRKVNKRAIQVQLRLTDAELEATLIAAKAQGFNISQWIRYAMRQYLSQLGIEINEPLTDIDQQGYQKNDR